LVRRFKANQAQGGHWDEVSIENPTQVSWWQVEGNHHSVKVVAF
jgi:hypothetical protein